MKIVHLADLHLGRLGKEDGNVARNLPEEQWEILCQIKQIIQKKKIEAEEDDDGFCVIIAGDVFQDGNPTKEALEMYGDFTYFLAENKIPTYIISGNHDNNYRLSYERQVMKLNGIYISPEFDGIFKEGENYIIQKDKYGEVTFYLIPFTSPKIVNDIYRDEGICEGDKNLFPTNMVESIVKHIKEEVKDFDDRRNVAIAHFYVKGSVVKEGGSEVKSEIGTLREVDAKSLEDFDYVALGHIHKPQDIRKYKNKMRYAGSPLQYTFNETDYKKTVTVVTLKDKETGPSYEEVELKLPHELKTLERNTLEEIKEVVNTGEFDSEAYYQIKIKQTKEETGSIFYDTFKPMNVLDVVWTERNNDNNQNYNGIHVDTGLSREEQVNRFYNVKYSEEMDSKQSELISFLFDKLEKNNSKGKITDSLYDEIARDALMEIGVIEQKNNNKEE